MVGRISAPWRAIEFPSSQSSPKGKVLMFQFIVGDTWRQSYPAAHAGVLVMRGALNPQSHPSLEHRKQVLDRELRSRYIGMDRKALLALPAIQAYNAYYKTFKKTYHIQLQLESFLTKGRLFPRVSALVDSMFMAELSNLLLTAGHDLATIGGPLHLEAASGTELYITLQGEEKTLKAGDMYIADQVGVISSVLYGPDSRSRISPQTKDALFTVYAPEGISMQAVRTHLTDICDNIRLVSPAAQVENIEVY
jgi:DNA/RNA-binding domain of Phe-tRNA-synthetase-like protein